MFELYNIMFTDGVSFAGGEIPVGGLDIYPTIRQLSHQSPFLLSSFHTVEYIISYPEAGLTSQHSLYTLQTTLL